MSGLINKAAKEMEDEYKLTKNIYEKVIFFELYFFRLLLRTHLKWPIKEKY